MSSLLMILIKLKKYTYMYMSDTSHDNETNVPEMKSLKNYLSNLYSCFTVNLYFFIPLDNLIILN